MKNTGGNMWTSHVRLIRILLLPLSLIFVSITVSCMSPEEPDRPNILFIAVDDLRPELGCYGVDHVVSPNIDRLASGGLLFSRAYCQSAVCNPSRASLMTGKRPDTLRVWDLRTDMRALNPEVVTLGQHLQANGYHSVGIGKIFHNTLPDSATWSDGG